MDNRIQHRLNSSESQKDVNIDAQSNIGLESNQELLPVGELNRIVNVGDRFNTERQSSGKYRLNGTISTLFSNTLFNTTGTDSYGSFLTNPDFRDGTYPKNGVDYDEDEDITYGEAINKYLKEIDGWYGYNDPNQSSNSLCLWTDMEPKRELFSFTPQNRKKNWELTITYPALSADTNMTQGGLLVVELTSVSVGNRPMIALTTPVKHGLTQGGTVRINGLSVSTYDGDYPIVRVGLDNGDYKEYSFVIDIDPSNTNISNNTRMIRMVSNIETDYYYRKFKKVSTINNIEIEDDDYDIYPLNFSKGLYNDINSQFVINEDIDISELTDNLGRPLSELYVTIIKTNSDQNDGGGSRFTQTKSGIQIPFIGNVNSFETSVPDIRRIHNGTSPTPHTPLDTNVLVTDVDFYGDVASYNRYEVKEIILGEVNHTFNTPNRETGGNVSDPAGFESAINMGNRYEGYFYKPHYQIKLREFSNYIEQGDTSTVGIPDYAEDLGDGRWLWRDQLELGFSDVSTTPIDYPFLNGSHYIHQNYCIPLRRQDPFAQYGLYYGLFPRDQFGIRMDDKFKINKSQDAC